MEARRGSNWPRVKKPFKESSKTQLLPHPNQKKVAAFVKAASSSIFHLSEFSTASIPSSQIHRHRIVSRYSPTSFSQIFFFYFFLNTSGKNLLGSFCFCFFFSFFFFQLLIDWGLLFIMDLWISECAIGFGFAFSFFFAFFRKILFFVGVFFLGMILMSLIAML